MPMHGDDERILNRSACCVSGTLYTLLLSLAGTGFFYSCCYRAKLRSQFGLTEEPCADCCVHWCCEPCALCQEYRELKLRGFDVSIGWQDNMERMGKGAQTAPPQTYQGMYR
ncbi:hypothetical protein EJB05_37612 [Eragrostis curvula]|uniref:Uncharacterized protein n=1 Tax=Eragrostis curvula TaxID=38414 RepID=A0A5J9TSB9_9POAL|nr:hypothetical protein EJB05_37612 [Eragrostis curvula]